MSVTPSPTATCTPTPSVTKTPGACNKNAIAVNMPGNIIANKYSNLLLRVGGENCCYPLSPNSFSNVVVEGIPRVPLPSQPPPPTPPASPTPTPSKSPLPEPPPPPMASPSMTRSITPTPTLTPSVTPSLSAITTLPCLPSSPNLNNYKVQVDFVKQCIIPPNRGHKCNRAKFILYINSIKIGNVNLNNVTDGGERFNTLNIPSGITPINNMYKIELVPDSSIRDPHKGIAKVTISNASNNIIFSQCLPDDKVSFIPACI